jgi:acetolactate synthase regulatory subunit
MIKRVLRVSHARGFRLGIIAVVVSVVLIFAAILVLVFLR